MTFADYLTAKGFTQTTVYNCRQWLKHVFSKGVTEEEIATMNRGTAGLRAIYERHGVEMPPANTLYNQSYAADHYHMYLKSLHQTMSDAEKEMKL